MATGDLRATSLPREIKDWLEQLKELVDNVKGWAEAAGWETRQTCRDVFEKEGSCYEVPVLVVNRDESEVSLVPVDRKVPGSDGLVALFLMPDFDDVASFYMEKGQWFFRYAFRSVSTETHSTNKTERFTLTEETLARVLNDIAAYA